MNADAATPEKVPVSPVSRKPVAVIEIGTTALRMVIAELDESGSIRPLDFLQQAISLGKDTFTRGYIEKDTIEECVQALKSFRHILDEYQITRDEQIRAVATTAVREAVNRLPFLDRLYIASGFFIEQLEEFDIARLTYHSFRQLLFEDSSLAQREVMVTEVGGGSTEILLVQKGDVVFSQTFRLGSLRLREILESFGAPVIRQRALMESDILGTIESIKGAVKITHPLVLALGGDIRFAASRLVANWNPLKQSSISVTGLSRFTEEVLSLSVNELVRKYHLPYPEAETIGPSLLFYTKLARALDLKSITVSPISMREGLLVEMGGNRLVADTLRDQIIRSALEIGRKYHSDEAHARHVAELSKLLFRALQSEHRLTPWHEVLLTTAALLHDIGLFVNIRNHHKHSLYLIQNSELFGLSKKDLTIVALIARYHRRASPKSTHEFYSTLDQESRLAVAKMASILRVADALDRGHNQRVTDITFSRDGNRFVVHVSSIDDIALEQLALSGKGTMFEEVYGMSVVLQGRDAEKE